MKKRHIRKIITGSTALFAARTAVVGIGVLRVAIIARFLGVSEFGVYSFAQSLIVSLLVFAELGLPAVVIREGARNRENLPSLVKSALLLRGPVILFILLACGVAFPLFGGEGRVGLLVVLLGIGFGTTSLAVLFQAPLRALLKMELVAAVQVLRKLVMLALICAALVCGFGLVGIGAAVGLTGFCSLAWSMALYRRYVGPMPFREKTSRLSFLAREGIPAAVSAVTLELLINLSVVLLTAQRGREEVAYFSAAVRFVAVFMFFPGAYQGAVYPILSELHHTSTETLKKLLGRSLEMMVAGGTALTVLTAFISKEAVRLIFGQGFEPAALALTLLSPFVLFSFISMLAYPFFVSVNRQRLGMVLSLSGLALTVILALPLAREFGFAGSALAVIMGAGFLGCSALIAIWRMGYCAGIGFFLLKTLLAGGAMAGVLQALSGEHAFLRVAAASVTYLLVLFLLKGFAIDYLKSLLQAARMRTPSDADHHR